MVYGKDTEPLNHSFMYSLVFSGIYPPPAMRSLLVTVTQIVIFIPFLNDLMY